MDTACIFGASGMTGRQLLYLLLANKDYSLVKIFVRRPIAVKHPKLEQIVTDFDNLAPIISELNQRQVFICLGTTIKQAGSQANFKAVDQDIPVTVAQAAAQANAACVVYISALGANAHSSNFYLRSKGQTEESLKQAFPGDLYIVRPSLLMGNRSQTRWGELVGKYVMIAVDKITFGMVLGRYKPIHGYDVAKAMVVCTRKPGRYTYESDMLHQLAKQY